MPQTLVADPVRRRAAVVATSVAVPVAVLLALLLSRGELRGDRPPAPTPTVARLSALPPVVVPPPAASAAGARACPALIRALPAQLGDLVGRPVRSGSSWVLAWGEPPVVLRCGVGRPAGFVVGGANVFGVNGVTWFAQPQPDRKSLVWTVVDREVYIEVRLPAQYASAPVPPISDAVKASLRAVPVRPGR
jgi:hypothetical protein